jgi:hypothetical protein
VFQVLLQGRPCITNSNSSINVSSTDTQQQHVVFVCLFAGMMMMMMFAGMKWQTDH